MHTQALSILQGYRQIFKYVPRRRRSQGIVVVVLMLAGAVAELLTLGAVLPFLAFIANPMEARSQPAFGWLLDTLGLVGTRDSITGLAILFCSVALLAAAVRILLTWASQKYVFLIGYDIGVALYRSVLYQPYSFHASRNSSEILSGVNKVQQILNQAMIPLLQAFTASIIAIFIVGGLLIISAGVALTSIILFGGIYLSVSYGTRKRLRSNSLLIAQANTQRLKIVQEGLGGIRDVLIDQAQPVYLHKFATTDAKLRTAQATNALIAAIPRFVIEGLGMAMIVVLALVLSRQPGGLTTALPVLGALALGAQRLLPLLQQMYAGWAQILTSRAAVSDVLGMLQQPLPADYRTRQNITPIDFVNHLVLQNVGFSYSLGGEPVLSGINLHIPKGARIGFIGRTGSGKSTLLDLVMGLLQPTEGGILIDGQRLDSRNLVAWQKRIAHVPQTIYLSDSTIIENIAFGLPRDRIDDARAEDAARKADVHDFVSQLPEGYNTLVGERGVRLSGGQRQRIGIARALYKQSALIILDEATSALDDVTEAAVMESIDRLGDDLTVLMIAHRLTTLRNCDRIYRLENGALVDGGDFASITQPAPAHGSAPNGPDH